MTRTRSKLKAQEARRTAAVLLCFTSDNPVLSVAEVVRLLGITAHIAEGRLIELTRLGFLEQTGAGRGVRYAVVPDVAELLNAAISVQRHNDLSRPVLEAPPARDEERYGQEIYRLTTENLSNVQIARLFGLSPERIRQIVNVHVTRNGGTIRASAAQANLLRVALLRAIGGPAAALQQASAGSEPQSTPESYLPHLRELDAYRRLLDTVGIQPPKPSRSVEIDLGAHRWALTHALSAERDRLQASARRQKGKARASIELIDELLAAAERRPA